MELRREHRYYFEDSDIMLVDLSESCDMQEGWYDWEDPDWEEPEPWVEPGLGEPRYVFEEAK